VGGFLLLAAILFSSIPVVAAGPPYYFKFNIPSGIHYSPGWHGYSNSCPDDVVVDLYNDKEGYGIAHTNKFTPKLFFVYTAKSEADKVLIAAKDESGVYFGQKLADRWLPEITVRTVDCVQKDDKSVALKYASDSLNPDMQSKAVKDEKVASEDMGGQVIQQKAVYCPICGAFIQWSYEGITNSRAILYCPNGHKAVTKGYD
jgi:hypothetical protein